MVCWWKWFWSWDWWWEFKSKRRKHAKGHVHDRAVGSLTLKGPLLKCKAGCLHLRFSLSFSCCWCCSWGTCCPLFSPSPGPRLRMIQFRMHHLVYRTWSRSFWPWKRWDKILTPFKPSKSKVQAARLAKYGTTLARIIFRGDNVRASSGGAGVFPPTIQSICKHCRIIRDVENPESAGGGLYEGLPSASGNAVDGGGHLCSVTSRIMAGGVRGKVATSNPLWIWTKSVWPSFWLQSFGICAFGRCWLLVCVDVCAEDDLSWESSKRVLKTLEQ